jgi:hypothetical protein
LGFQLLQQTPDFVQIFVARLAFHTAGEINAAGLEVAEGLQNIVWGEATGQEPGQGQRAVGQLWPVEGLPSATRTLGVIGVQKQSLHTVAVEVGCLQICQVANAQGLNAANAREPFSQLPALFWRFPAVELNSREAAHFHPGGNGTGIRIHKDPHLFHMAG